MECPPAAPRWRARDRGPRPGLGRFRAGAPRQNPFQLPFRRRRRASARRLPGRARAVGLDDVGRRRIQRLRRDGVDDQAYLRRRPGASHAGRVRRLSRERRTRLLVLRRRLRRRWTLDVDTGRAAGGPRRLAARLRVDAGVRGGPARAIEPAAQRDSSVAAGCRSTDGGPAPTSACARASRDWRAPRTSLPRRGSSRRSIWIRRARRPRRRGLRDARSRRRAPVRP